MHIESLNEFHSRTYGFMTDSLPHNDKLNTHPALAKKVDESGAFRPFWGNTMIFELEKADRDWLRQAQDLLYERCGMCLAERLSPDSFHITLHDMANSHNCEQIAPWVDVIGANAIRRLDEILPIYPHHINLRAARVFSMMNTSIVAGFEPSTDEDCAILMRLYDEFQSVYYLDYPLTPHVTLAYYKPGSYSEQTVAALDQAFNDLLVYSGRHITLDLDNLHYSRFRSMNE